MRHYFDLLCIPGKKGSVLGKAVKTENVDPEDDDDPDYLDDEVGDELGSVSDEPDHADDYNDDVYAPAAEAENVDQMLGNEEVEDDKERLKDIKKEVRFYTLMSVQVKLSERGYQRAL